VEVLAPAKINLSLRVAGVRPDGFHEIETMLCPISVFDRLHFRVNEREGIGFTCDDPTLPHDESNLVVRAALLFFSETGIQPTLEVALQKTIPHGAGLGGGSSDAAATLLALNRLFETGLPRETLVSMAAELGSDVPFFIYQSSARGTGRGEVVAPVPFPHRLPLLLIKQPFGVPTAWAYARWQTAHALPGTETSQTFAWGELHNDLERPVFEKYLFLAVLKEWLRTQEEVAGALLAGSGSTVFAVLREAERGGSLAQRVTETFGPNLWMHLCETIDVSVVSRAQDAYDP
jgi:4-diphosphocytidyl-2-C-methyl-D-erythritol kinase